MFILSGLKTLIELISKTLVRPNLFSIENEIKITFWIASGYRPRNDVVPLFLRNTSLRA